MWTSAAFKPEALRWRAAHTIRYYLHFTVKSLIVRKCAAAPVDFLLLVASLRKNGQGNEPGRLVHSLEPTVGNDNSTVLPSPIGLQFVRKLQTLRYSDDVNILVRPNFPV